MFVGHEFVAFALAVTLASVAGADDETVLTVGLIAAASAVLPDLDLVTSVLAYAQAPDGLASASWEGLWGASTAIHRGLSHTLVAGVTVATVVGTSALGRRSADAARWFRTLAAIGVVAGAGIGLGAIGLVTGGAAELFSIALVVSGAVVLGTVVGGRTTLGAATVLGAALIGLLTHPFGDVFLATPPAAFYPLDLGVLGESVRFAADPTVNLVAIAIVELGAVWTGVFAYVRVRGVRLGGAVAPVAAIGLGYPLLMAVVPRPTMADAHWLGFTLAPVALVGALALRTGTKRGAGPTLRAVVTGTAAMTGAVLAYLLAYLLVFRP